MENRTKAADGSFSERAEELSEQAMAELDRLRQHASDVSEHLVAFIRERPGTALLIAAAAGYLIGRIARS
jgi:hypothetical protein